MAEATCLNDNCEKDKWTLRKHPDDYARGVTCPECGTTNVDVDVPEGQEGGQPQAPARRREGTGSRPAVEREVPRAVDRGVAGGDALFDIANANSTGDMIQGIGAAFMQIGERQKEKRSRRREAAASVDAVEKSESYPRCPECNAPIQEKPVDQDEFPCPECREPLVVV